MRLEIGHTWDGIPLPHDARAVVQVHGLDASEGEVRVDVIAPFAADTPPFAPPGPVDQLWEYEVVELFVVGADGHYTELELGPYGHHLLLQLSGVREVAAKCLPVAFEARRAGDRWAGTARVARDCGAILEVAGSECPHGCGAEIGADLPAVVMDQAKSTVGLCLASPFILPRCDASHAATRRLCVCTSRKSR